MKNYYLILHSAVSLNGKIEGFPIKVDKYYALASVWDEDITLVGSRTILESKDLGEDDPQSPNSQTPATSKNKPILVIVDSEGKVKKWNGLRESGYWGNFISLVSEQTPKEHLDYLTERGIEYVIAGVEKVDLSDALQGLSEKLGRVTIRVDSGEGLNTALLNSGLVDEISLLVHPFIARGEARNFTSPGGIKAMEEYKLVANETHGDGLIWLRYHKQN